MKSRARRLRVGTLAAALLLTVAMGGAPPPVAGPAAPAEAPDASWLARAQPHIAEREYWASENGEGLQAPNRAHDLRTYFEPTGIRVHGRTAGGPELLRLSLSGIGRGKALAAAPAGGEVVADGHRVEIHRPGLVEWYLNTPAGLEQGFTLAERPAGAGPLVVELAVAGARPALRGEAIVFETGAQRKLAYGALVANDAEGRPLAAHFELAEGERLRIVVDDAGASYPLVIDPLLTETADTQLESDQADAWLGWSVAGAGDTNGDGYADVIVGAPLYDAGQTDEGAALVFLGSAAGIADGTPLTAAAQLEADQADARLGESVAGAGDVNGDGYADVVVGALGYDAGQINEGAAFVFLGSAVGIANSNPPNAAAQLESDQESALLGASVAGAGDTNGDGYADVIVGAPLYDAGQTDEGAAFVFLGNGEGRPVVARQRRGDGSGTPVQPWGGSHSSSGFAAELIASHPDGTGRVRAELEVCRPEAAFGGAGCVTALTPSWVTVDGATPETVLSHPFTDLASDTLYRWRARVLHAPATGAIPASPAHGPWRRLSAQAVEADVRVLPEPALGLGLACAAALLAALARRRGDRS